MLLAGLYSASFASAFSWHSIRIGLACSLHAADCPDAVIQLICRWANPASLKVYRQVGIEKNIFWTEKAQSVTFDATRVNNLPVLDNDDRMARQIDAFTDGGPAATVTTDRAAAPAPVQPSQSFPIPGGTVLATTSDANGLVGRRVNVFNHLWPGYPVSAARTWCTVAARCVREFRHPDDERCLTYLVEWNGNHFPIKHSGLLTCVSQAVRATLPTQRAFQL
jgi:hypothetical protein